MADIEWTPLESPRQTPILELLEKRYPLTKWEHIKFWKNLHGCMGLYKNLSTGRFHAFFEMESEIFYEVEWESDADVSRVMGMFNRIAVFAGCAFEMKLMKTEDADNG